MHRTAEGRGHWPLGMNNWGVTGRGSHSSVLAILKLTAGYIIKFP